MTDTESTDTESTAAWGPPTQVRRPRRANLLPSTAELVDAGFVAALTVLAILTLRGTFDGAQYLVVGGTGVILGLLVAHLAIAVRLPWPLVPFALAAGYLLVGGALALRDVPGASWLPTPATLRALVGQAIHGWSRLLTTLPPVERSGPLLALPLLIGIFGAGVGLTVARRWSNPGFALVVPAATLVLTILLGTRDPGSQTIVGIVGGLLCVLWVGLRSRGRVVQTGTGRIGRAVTMVAVLLVSAAGVFVLGPALPGTDLAGRTVLRAKVTPPLDLSAFATPLVGFRAFRPASHQLADRTLFTVHGLPAATPIRIATLDAYDGVVWSVRNIAASAATGRALDSFQKVGPRIATAAHGSDATMRVTIGASYAATASTNGWLPDAGSVTAIDFRGPNRAGYTTNTRYNLATGTALVPERVRAGTSYALHTVVSTSSSTLPARAQPLGAPVVDGSAMSFVTAPVARWTAKMNGTPWEQLLGIARLLRTTGAYSDGGPGETQYLPGHGAGRLNQFLTDTELVGDDEQYAAAFALIANDLGFPARVVVGATPSAAGAVHGADVHAWVEVALRGHGWVPVATDVFTPPTTRKPHAHRQQEIENADSSVVPPPNAVRPPSSLDQLTQATSNSSRQLQHETSLATPWQLPTFVKIILYVSVPPIVLALLLALAIVVIKALRRRRRRLHGTPAGRVVAGWRELLDQARDLGVAIAPNLTRREQAELLPEVGAGALAADTDHTLFSPRRPEPADSVDYWNDVRHLRHGMLLSVSRWRRVRARLSIRSLRPMSAPGASTE